MSTVTLRIQVDKSGASENIGAVKRDLQGMGETGAQAGAQASTGVNGLSSAINGAKAAVGAFLAVYAGIQALSGVVRLADEYETLSGQLRLVTNSTAEFSAAQAGVFAIAQQSGTALGGVNSLYASIARSTDELNLSQGQLLTITQAVSQSMAVSNTSAAAASGAITQLGQAFASGVLRGDEFNSVNEAAPRLMEALAASLGVTRGELRAMAEAGQLTSDVLARGLLTQAPAIAAEFGTMSLTVGRAFTQLSNSVLKFVGEASQSTGAASALATVITGLANGLPAVAFGLTAVAAGYGAVTAAALVANPAIGFTATLLAGAATAMGALVVAYSAYKLGEYLVNEFTIVQAAVRSLYVGLNDAWTAIKVGALQAVAAIRIAFITAFDAITDRLADLIEAFVSFSQIELPMGLRADFAYGQAEAMTTLAGTLRDASDAVVENDTVTGALQAEMTTARASAEQYAASMFDAVDAHGANAAASGENAEATERVGAAAALTKDQIKELAKAADAAASASDALTKEQERLVAATSPLNALYVDLAQKLRAVDEWEVKLTASQGLSADEADRLRAVRVGLTAALVKELQAVQSIQNPYQTYISKLNDERRLLGLSATERTRAESQIRAVANVMAYANEQRQRGNGLLVEEIEKLILHEQQLDRDAEATARANAKTEEWRQYWLGATDAVLGSFGDLFSGGIDSLEEFGDQMLQISQRIVSDMLKEFARTGRIQIGPGMFGAGGTGSSIAGWGNALGMAYGGYQNAQNGGNPLATVGSFALAGASIAGPVGAAVGAIVGGLVAAFSGDNNPLLRVRSSEFSGPRRSEGQATSQLGSIFVRTENTPDGAGTSPEIAQRIADFDNLIAGFLSADQLSAIRGALGNVNDTFENGAFTIENALNSRFGTILGALDSNIQEFVGSAGTLEQRVARLTDALTIAAIAASDNGISDSFDDLATLFTRFRLQGEGVADTFQRLSFGVGLIDDTLLMLGGTFNGTRLQAATFAGELIELAGGLDQFSARLNGALEALFSEPERNQFLLDQARASLNSALAGLNISGTGVDNIREQLRTQLRDAMAAGNSALVNELLIAGNALGAFTQAVGRVGDEAGAALTGMFGSSNAAGTIGPGSLTSPAGTAVQTQLAAVQSTNTILNVQTGILTRIEMNTKGPGAGTSSGNGLKSAGGDPAAILARIEALIQQSVRTQVTEALKRTTGANKRAATA